MEGERSEATENVSMNYLEIKPDYVESGVKSEFDGYLELEKLPFDGELKRRIKSLNDGYRKIIPMGEKGRQAHMDLIYQLDEEGYRLKTTIEEKYGIKVKYFSEGRLMYLFAKPDIADYPSAKGFQSKVLRVIQNLFGGKEKE